MSSAPLGWGGFQTRPKRPVAKSGAAPHVNWRATSFAVVLAVILFEAGFSVAFAQQSPPKIWDVQVGTSLSDLPDEEFVDPACGTNGGPPGLRLGGFEEFAKCRPESSGLREIWFRYDDEAEYVARAARDPDAVARSNAMLLIGQPVTLSLLADSTGRVQGYRIFTDPRADPEVRKEAYSIAVARSNAMLLIGQPVTLSLLADSTGRVQGYRIFTDPRADPELRKEAYSIGVALKARFGLTGWECEALPRAEGETPIDGVFVKERCRKTADLQKVTLESRHYYKPGQSVSDPNTGLATVNQFESSARLEVVAVGALAK